MVGLRHRGLVRRRHPVRDRPRVPLWAQARPNVFKLYLFDVGLLGHMLGLSYADQQAQEAGRFRWRRCGSRR